MTERWEALFWGLDITDLGFFVVWNFLPDLLWKERFWQDFFRLIENVRTSGYSILWDFSGLLVKGHATLWAVWFFFLGGGVQFQPNGTCSGYNDWPHWHLLVTDTSPWDLYFSNISSSKTWLFQGINLLVLQENHHNSKHQETIDYKVTRTNAIIQIAQEQKNAR